MNYPYYQGNPKNRQETPAALPVSRRAGQEDPAGYLPDPGLVDAVNVALLLGQPLLLTGEAGTGKTQLAYSVAWELGFEAPVKFETKSTSTARDLFYSYDTLARFHAAQTGEGSKNSLDYLTFNALGLAILRANEEAEVKKYFPPNFSHGGRRRSVVLIDEIDKAPRDFPNDILNEVEEMYFKIPELGNIKIAADPAMRPILLLTSNSEKHLPEAFLRRCIYYHLAFPQEPELLKARLTEIVTARLGRFTGKSSPLLDDALDLFQTLRREDSNLNKKPATAELLGWLLVLRELNAQMKCENILREKPAACKSSLQTLIKTKDDQDRAQAVWEEWRQKIR